MSGRKFYHGGVRGLKKGDKLLPPSKTGVSTMALMAQEYGQELAAEARHSSEHVYFSRVRSTAALFALGTHGDLYEVKPIGPYGVDPDSPDDSFKARAARVVRVIARYPVSKDYLPAYCRDEAPDA